MIEPPLAPGVPSPPDARTRAPVSVVPFLVVLVVAAVLAGIALMLNDAAIPPGTRLQAYALWILCLFPAWASLRTPAASREPIPFVPIIGVFYGLYFALPVVLGAANLHWRITLNPAVDYDAPVEMALAGWLALLAAYYGGGVFLPVPRPLTISLDPVVLPPAGALLLLLGVVADVAYYSGQVPSVLAAVVRFSATLSWLGVGLLIIAGQQQALSAGYRALLAGGVVTSAVIQISTGSIANVAFLGIAMIISVWVARGALSARWVVAGAAIVVLVLCAKGAAEEFRESTWWGSAQDLSTTDRTALMLGLLKTRMERGGIVATLSDGAEAMAQRSALADGFADVVRRTPQEIPYWGGESYRSLVGTFVPRVLWPDKPAKDIGQRFGRRYQYLHPRDTWTSINLPYTVEFYVNFGYAGVLLGSFLVGLIYRFLMDRVNHPAQSPVGSVVGIVLLLPLLNIESDFSLTFGGLVMNGLALTLVYRWLQSWSLRQRRPSPERAEFAYTSPGR